ncbi:protein of unknown function DUF924 [[Leptolyngbya] sp. PCC 7376]|uniref:DUF924 family protein n=1 Tax=[Leptolyngbya] sp. PCC 7376 TaxID=111781 RepID=UPI00029F36FE|nr:DUF924 family protein [[Leptolyngbya] sp. PCC 7376]AFY38717.1 protein of unknown function DUF924 [[Leptolyngbya] sp. PCC 7376]
MREAWQIVNDFWFGELHSEIYGTSRKEWFIKNPLFDDQVRETLGSFHKQAKNDTLDSWQVEPMGCVALMILLDQVPRNLFRNSPQAFATDKKALGIAKQAIAQNLDKDLLVVQRLFLYLPFEHSEDIEDQRRSLELFAQLEDNPISQSYIDYAQKHFDVIDQFGRFPHRNKILGRESTEAELEFLSKPGSSF